MNELTRSNQTIKQQSALTDRWSDLDVILPVSDSQFLRCYQPHHTLFDRRSDDSPNSPLHSCSCRHLVVATVNGGLWAALPHCNMGSNSPVSSPTAGGEDHSFHMRENYIKQRKSR